MPSRAVRFRIMSLSAAALVSLCLLIGCHARSEGKASAPPPPSSSTLSVGVPQTQVLQAIKGMTAEQRAAYFKAHPQDARLLNP